MDLEKTSIERLKVASDMSLRLFKKPLLIAYSGGKDSDILLHLAEKSGIIFEVLHSLTTADAPQTVHHAYDVFRRLEEKGIKCEIDKHKKADGSYTTMWNLIPKKLMPPTRLARYCCDELKEGGGRDRFVSTGVRWAESTKRKNRGNLEIIVPNKNKSLFLNNDNEEERKLFEACTMKGKRMVNPIIDWKDRDIWDYCASEKICMNPLYECGFKRVGCIGCPLAGKSRYTAFAMFPKYKSNYIKAFDRMLIECERRGKEIRMRWGNTGEEVFHWWMQDGVINGQINFEEMES